jgi:signal transduction histidine kinase
MSAWGRLRGWLRSHPLAADAILAAAVFVVAITVRPEGPGFMEPVTAATISLLALSCASLVLRRQFPLPVWGFTTLIGVAGVIIAAGPSAVVLPAFVGVYTVATQRSRSNAIVAALVTVLAMVVALVIAQPEALQSPTTYAVLAWGGMATAIGIAVRSQRAIVAAAEERALRAEASRDDEARRAVTEERLRIARELHDVVAHHISVINVQAGVARHLLDENPTMAGEALGHIRESSQVVLSELSTILGLLRNPGDDTTTAPAPGLDQLDALIDSVRRSGVTVTVRSTGPRPELAPVVDLTAYRLTQEALTNARKHGTGVIDVELAYDTDQLILDVRNRIAAGVDATRTGHGLIGMQERVTAVGGQLDTGARADGTYTVHAVLPIRLRDIASAPLGQT